MTQVPAPTKATEPAPLTVQTPADAASAENTTGLPDAPPVAVTVYEPPTAASDGGVEVNVIVCVPLATGLVCWTCAARRVDRVACLVGVKDAGPGRPRRPPNRRRSPCRPDADAASDRERHRVADAATGRGRRVGVPDLGDAGGVEVKVIVWEPLATVMVCWTWGAAR